MNLLKKPGAWVPILVPVVFISWIILDVSKYGVVYQPDEGVGAHLFQIWLVLAPILVLHFAFRNWRENEMITERIVVAQIVATGLLILSVHHLGL